MSEWKQEWEQRLRQRPFKQRRFSPMMMHNVVQRVESPNHRKLFRRMIIVMTSALLLLVVPGLFLLNNAMNSEYPLIGDGDPTKGGFIQLGAGTQVDTIKLGDGGNLVAWADMEASRYDANDRTLIQFVQALLQRKLGILGPSSPVIDTLWEQPEDKQVLERYELSSPWVAEVIIEGLMEDAEERVYELRLLLTDSTAAEFTEELQLTIRKSTSQISQVTIVDPVEHKQLNNVE